MKDKIELRLFDMDGNDVTEIRIRCQKCGWRHSIPQWKWNEHIAFPDDTRLVFCKECREITSHKKEDPNEEPV